MIAQIFAVAALMSTQASATQTPPPARPCFTTAEAGAMAAVVLPEMVGTFSRSCAAHLPANAFLRTSGAELVERWRSEAAGERQVAMSVGARMGMFVSDGSSAAAAADPAASDAQMRQMMDALASDIGSRLNATNCKEISRFVESIAPLPAANVAQMVSALLGFAMGMMPPGGDNGPPICR